MDPRRGGAANGPPRGLKAREKKEPKTLFQQFFKSVGTRTYVAQVKEAGNGNQFLVLTEAKPDEKTGEIRKTRLFVFSEDFDAYKLLLRDAFKFLAEHPMPADLKRKREAFWKKRKANPQPSNNGSR